MTACADTDTCETSLLSNDQIYKRAEQARFIPKDAPVYSETGAQIPRDSVSNYNRLKYAYAQYVDCKDSIVKLEISKIKPEDKVLRAKIDSLYSNNIDLMQKRIKWVEKDPVKRQKMMEMAIYHAPPKIFEVDCDSISSLIRTAFKKDQSNRKGDINLLKDKENLELIESIVANCSLKAIKNEGEPIIYRFFMIVQHAPAKYREKYISFFKRMSEEGLLRKQSLALMIDRMLIENGSNQRYGTQYRTNSKTGEIELHPINEPDKVDSLRATMGMGPLGEYVEKIEE